MPLADWTKKQQESFLTGIAPIEDAYHEESFSYLAINDGQKPVVVQATLYLNLKRPSIPTHYFESANVRAGHFLLSDIGISRSDFIEAISSGKLSTPNGELAFSPNKDSQTFGAQHFPFHESGGTQRRVSVLSIYGGDTSEYFAGNRQHLDWEVRAASRPYDGIQELLNEFQPGVPGSNSRIDVTAVEVVAIDASSVVDGENAKLMIRTAVKASPERVSVGFRVVDQGRTIQRERISGTKFDWCEMDGLRLGTINFPIPKSAVVQGMISYNGIAQNYYAFGDPKSFLNPLRAAFEAGDPKLGTLKETLAKAQSGRVDSRHFEAAIAGLFWMLGFAPMHIDGLPKMNDAADILLFSPGGSICVVECTVGMLKEDHKLPGLHERVEAVKRNLDVPSTKHVKILPIIVTSKTAAEIKPDLEQAEKLGVYVITRETIDRLLERTLFPAAADLLFGEAEQATQEKLAKYELS